MLIVWDHKSFTLKFLVGNLILCSNYQKKMFYAFKRFEECFMEALLDFLKKLKIIKTEKKVQKIKKFLY